MDWKNIIQEIAHTGMTQQEIGDEVGMKQSSVADVLSGRTKSVRWEVGNNLLALHKRATKKKKAA